MSKKKATRKKASKKKANGAKVHGRSVCREDGPQTQQVQLYLQPLQVAELDADTAVRQEEVRQLMGVSRKVSRSAHGGSIISNYLRVRAIDPSLSYQDFWERVKRAIESKKRKQGSKR